MHPAPLLHYTEALDTQDSTAEYISQQSISNLQCWLSIATHTHQDEQSGFKSNEGHGCTLPLYVITSVMIPLLLFTMCFKDHVG